MVELLLAKARPSELLSGKILGIGVVGFVQLIVFVVIGWVAAGSNAGGALHVRGQLKLRQVLASE